MILVELPKELRVVMNPIQFQLMHITSSVMMKDLRQLNLQQLGALICVYIY